MKNLAILFFALMISQFASAVTLEELVGSYKITHPYILDNLVTIHSNGNVELIEINEINPRKDLYCFGTFVLSNDIITSSMKCKNGREFTQTIDLTHIKNFKEVKKFKANVFSSLYEQEIEMDFERL